MKIAQYQYSGTGTWEPKTPTDISNPQLVLVFGGRQKIAGSDAIAALKQKFPQAQMIGCTTAGEILNTSVSDGGIVATAIHFEKSNVVSHHITIDNMDGSYEAGRKIITLFNHNHLRHIFVLTDGLMLNGSEFVRGMREELPDGVTVTGGLAGDGADFKQTLVFNHEMEPSSGVIAAVGFYGDDLKLGYASMGGWDSFGIERLVTKAKHNVLYELDGQPALDLYKSFLGEQANELPASALLFPLSIRNSEGDKPIVRTILGINEEEKSMTFAGDIPEGSYVRLMKANVDRLIGGSMEAAEKSMQGWERSPELAILISCVGRKLVLKQMVEEEVEAAQENFGKETAMTGFYSYGEISPFMKFLKCELHNQTMTITLVSES